MKTSIQAAAAVVTLFASQAALAQGAVQWKVSDGGNGHWYAVLAGGTPLGWSEARARARALGADLASTETLAEWSFVKSVLTNDGAWNGGHGPWLGGYQDYSLPDFAEPAAGWRWVSGQPMVFTAWWTSGPQPSNYCDGSPEDFLHVIDRDNPAWNDIGEPSTCQVSPPRAAVLEWSADCNNDGLVDYGQCRDGYLADLDADNIPDCCEQGVSCAQLDLGLEAAFSFEGDFLDHSGNGRDGAANSVSFGAGPSSALGQAAIFDGVSSQMFVSGVPVPANNRFSWALWLRSDEIAYSAIVERIAAIGNNILSPWIFTRADGGLSFGSYSYASGGTSVETNAAPSFRVRGCISRAQATVPV